MAQKDISILVVEDDPDLLDIIVDFLEDEDYYVRGSESAEDAFNLVSKVKFDLLLTDVRLPGCNGVEGFLQLKQEVPDLRCVLMTGYADDDIQVKALRSHVEDYLHKPFKLNELARVVERVTGRQKLATHYFGLLQKAPGKFFNACRGFFLDSASLDRARSQAFNNLYVAIRAKLLLADAANGVFSQLVQLDEEYNTYMAQPEGKTKSSLTEKYRDLSRFMAALSRSGSTVLRGERIDSGIFRNLYSSVQKGDITPEQMQLAPSLMMADEGALSESPELLLLRSKMWSP